MSTQARPDSNNLRNHRPPAVWRRMPERYSRVFRWMRDEAMQELPNPLSHDITPPNAIDGVLAHIILRDIVYLEKETEIDQFMASKSVLPGVRRLRQKEVSIFDRRDYAQAMSVRGVQGQALDEYLKGFVGRYPDISLLSAVICKPVILGASPNQPGFRYVGLSFMGKGADQIVHERAGLRLGIPNFPGRIFSAPHCSLLETRDQQMAEEIREELAGLALEGTEVVLQRPELWRARRNFERVTD